MFRGFILFICLVLSVDSAYSENINHIATDSPTNFSGELNSLSTGTLFQSGGEMGKIKTLRIRGAQPKDTAVFLEGIRLNSASFGEYDFGNLSNTGIEGARITRGGYSLFSSQPSGAVNLSLPREEVKKAKVYFGAYQSFGIETQVPHLALSLEQGTFDFPYEENGKKAVRENNISRRFNLRTWKLKKNENAWIQLLYVDQGIPGSLEYPSPHAEMKSFSPTMAYQFKWKDYEFHNWINYKLQGNADTTFDSENNWLTIGQRTEKRFSFSSFQIPTSIEWTLDKLWIEQIEAGLKKNVYVPWRNTVATAAGILWDLTDHFLVNPSIRAEWLSDLRRENFSIHPGIGLKYTVNKEFWLLSNTAWISRAPDFNEMYFAIPPYAEKNPFLTRQRSLQSDIGFIFSNENIEIEEALFVDRTTDILQSDPNNPVYKVLNRGISLSYGWESKIAFHGLSWGDTNFQYTLQKSMLGEQRRIYQPTHRLSIEQIIYASKNLEFKIPFSYRSKVAAGSININQQIDLSAEAAYQLNRFLFKATVKNLLSWNRIEIRGYPLGNEPIYQVSAEAEF